MRQAVGRDEEDWVHSDFRLKFHLPMATHMGMHALWLEVRQELLHCFLEPYWEVSEAGHLRDLVVVVVLQEA